MARSSEWKDWRANHSAVLYPAGKTRGDGALPAIEVASVMVFAYVEDGELHVGVHLDNASDSDYWHLDEAAGVPLRFYVSGTEVYAADRNGVVTAVIPNRVTVNGVALKALIEYADDKRAQTDLEFNVSSADYDGSDHEFQAVVAALEARP